MCTSMLKMLANIVKELVDAYVDWVELKVTKLEIYFGDPNNGTLT